MRPVSPPTRVLAYARVSSFEQGTHGTSLDAQREEIERYVALSGYPKPLMFVETESGGGTGEARLEQVRLMAEVRAGDVVLVAKQDRWSRDTRHFLASIDAITAKGARFFSIAERFDPSTAEGRFAVTVMATVSELERARIRDRTVGARHRLRLLGLWVEGAAPLGYRRDDQARRLVVDEKTAPIVARLFALCIAGRSTRQIAARLREEFPGVPGLDASACAYRLRDRRYLGCLEPLGKRGRRSVHGERTWIEGTHPALVDPATWQAAQKALDVARIGGAPLQGDARNAGFLLRGLPAVCSLCGARLRARANDPRGVYKHAGYYVCPKRVSSRCEGPIARQDRVDAEVERRVLGRLERDAARLARAPRAEAPPPRTDFAALRDALAKKRERLIDAVENGTLPQETIQRRLLALSAQGAELDRREADEHALPAPPTDDERRERLAEVKALREGWARMTVAERRAVVAMLVAEIRLSRDTTKPRWTRGTWALRLTWKE